MKKPIKETTPVKEVIVKNEYQLHPGVSGETGTFYVATKLGFVVAAGVFDRDIRKAKPFETWNAANSFAKSMFPKYWAVLKA